MSHEAVTAVLEHSRARLSDRLVLLVIAEAAHKDGTGCTRGKTSIGARAGLHRSTVTASIANLERAGELVVRRRPGRPSEYDVILPTLGKTEAPAPVSRPDFSPPSRGRARDGRADVPPRTVTEPLNEPAQGTMLDEAGDVDEWLGAQMGKLAEEGRAFLADREGARRRRRG